MSQIIITRHVSQEELISLWRGAPDVRTGIRYLAILKLYESFNLSQVGAMIHCSRQDVSNWLKRWNEGGPEAMREGKHTGRPCRLTAEQQQELKEHIAKPPREEGHDFNVWYLQNIAGHVQEQYDTIYSVSGVQRLRKRVGLVYRVPRVEPVGCPDEKKQRSRINKTGSIANWNPMM